MKGRKFTLQEIRSKISAYCARQERCHQEVELKLKEWLVPYDQRDELIAFLIENNFLNEERFARAYARGRFRLKKWGRVKILHELRKRAISEYSQKQAMGVIDDNEYLSTLYELLEKKLSQHSGEVKLKRFAKSRSYLSQKGYEIHLINEALKHYD